MFSIFAPTLLRLALACALFYVAYMQYHHRRQISAMQFPLVGHNFVAPAIAFHVLVGAMLLFGYYTQIAALLAIVGFTKGVWLNKRYPSVAFLPNSTVYVLIVGAVSLLFTGAGAFAFDIPL